MKTLKVISINENGIIWIENNKGLIFGIVDSNKILDCDGLPYFDHGRTLDVIDQHFDAEISYSGVEGYEASINTDCNSRLVFKGDDTIELIDNSITMLMNPIGGDVQSDQEWLNEGFNIENSTLIEVRKNSKGEWFEVE